MAKLTGRERYWRGIRHERLQSRGFFAWEAVKLERFPMTRSYMRRLIRARQGILLKAIKEDWTTAEYRYAIRTEYEFRDWLDANGRLSPYKMIRHYRKISIALGEYTPPPPKKKGWEKNWPKWKGDVAAQKKRWRATHRQEIAASKRRWREKQREKRRGGGVVFDEKLGRYVVR